MSPRLILLIVLLEGFVTISAEILTIRQLIPFVGSSVVVTSVIIGVFLLFLAYGYRAGGRVQSGHANILKRNFLWAAGLLGVGLSYFFIYFWFALWKSFVSPNDLFPLISYLLMITAPLVYVLGQTVPLTLHLFPDAQAIKTGALGGRILHVNTLGSFLGAVLTSVLLFSLLGVGWTVAINTCVLLALAIFLGGSQKQLMACLGVTLVALPVAIVLNVHIENTHFLKANHYANYRVSTISTPFESYKRLEVNNTAASKISTDGTSFAYIETIKSILFNDMKKQGEDILVLGAGGFTLSLDDHKKNRFVYIDIDPDIKPLSETYFSGPVSGEFIAKDARSFVQTTDKRFDAIVVDTYNSPLAVPQHLMTQEYFESLVHILKPGGVVLVNMIANPQFNNLYARRVDRTLRSVLGYCTNQPQTHKDELTNLVYVCYPDHRTENDIYTDNLNTVTLDSFSMK